MPETIKKKKTRKTTQATTHTHPEPFNFFRTRFLKRPQKRVTATYNKCYSSSKYPKLTITLCINYYTSTYPL